MHLVECPRDAMQGWTRFIPTPQKVQYINALLGVGFDTIDFGSFVSPKAIPQMADTRNVIEQINYPESSSRLLAIVANARGAAEAGAYDAIRCLGYPFSISETFQQRNANSSIEESFKRVEEIRNLCIKIGKQLVIYISMGFGNPYGDLFNEDVLFYWIDRLVATDIQTISLADTVGLASPEQINRITSLIITAFPKTEIGVHLHSRPDSLTEKLDAALHAGCRRFDGALKGIGGCPMAGDILVGNLETERMVDYFNDLQLIKPLNTRALENSLRLAAEIFEA